MKKILTLLLTLTALAHAFAEDSDWRKEAREFMDEQHFAPIDIKPDTPSFSTYERERWTWLQRILLPPFERHLEKWPEQAAAARSFVKQALMIKVSHPDVDPARPFEVVAKEGVALIKSGMDDPLVFWLTAWSTWEFNEAYDATWRSLSKALRHKLLTDYPPVLLVYLNDLGKETQRGTQSKEVAAKAERERYDLMMKSAKDPSVYGPEDDRLLSTDIHFIFSFENIQSRLAELEQFCETPGFSPWLQEMLRGNLQNRIAWNYRGQGYANTVKPEDWRKFGEYQVKARPHFLKAWELRPDRAVSASAMIEIVKCGNGRPGDTVREWFDRAVAAEPLQYGAYYNYLWALRPRWGGSLDSMKAFYCACALTDRVDSTFTSAMRRTLDYLEEDTGNSSAFLTRAPMQQTVMHVYRRLAQSDNVYRVWQHSWRQADLGIMAWKAADYVTAYETLEKLPSPLPAQSRRLLNHAVSEIEVRGQSAIFAVGMKQEWDAAEEHRTQRHFDEALQSYQDIASRFQGAPPVLLMERIAACKFESAFATGRWVPIKSSADLGEWHRGNGSWSALEDGTLVNTGTDARAYIFLNGSTGPNFELMGEYEVKDIGSTAPGLGIILGYRRLDNAEDWIACSQWQNSDGVPIASMLHKIYQTSAPHLTPPLNGRTWKFHILCQDGAVTYRLNHRDIVVSHRVATKGEAPFKILEDSTIGFGHHFLDAKSHTHIRSLQIRRLESTGEQEPEKVAPASLASLRSSFEARCQQDIARLNAAALIEADTQAEELQRAHKDPEAAKVRALAAKLHASESVRPSEVPAPVTGETTLAAMLRGYFFSLNARLQTARAEWKARALTLHKTLKDSPEAAELQHYISSQLEDAQAEEPLAAANRLKWQSLSGEWHRTSDVLTGSGDSSQLYEFNRKPPFQIDFDINVLEGQRPRLILGKVKFANEGDKSTFGIYPRAKDAPLFEYEHKRPYHITLKATAEKTELFIDGAHVCDGPKIEDAINVLQFRSGDGWSKGKAEFHKVRISPLP